ncbi:MAG TPA: hypothetical protein QGH10_06300, partial [Armatimonadota bacterium]|nr:hypothetical protein [Armatimonadota bacterium]
GEPAPAERELADGVLEQVKKQRWCADTAENERARAVAHEVLGSTARARDGWQRVCLSLWAVCEPTHSPLWDRAWSHVERLGGKHWD